MQFDPVLVQETRAWFERADEDLKAAAVLLAAVPPLLASAVFHGQQAAEKALKGYLTWHSVSLRKSHDILEVGQPVVALDPSLDAVVRRSAVLSDYAWSFRYPGGPTAPSDAEARHALALAREVYEAILSRLPEEARP